MIGTNIQEYLEAKLLTMTNIVHETMKTKNYIYFINNKILVCDWQGQIIEEFDVLSLINLHRLHNAGKLLMITSFKSSSIRSPL